MPPTCSKPLRNILTVYIQLSSIGTETFQLNIEVVAQLFILKVFYFSHCLHKRHHNSCFKPLNVGKKSVNMQLRLNLPMFFVNFTGAYIGIMFTVEHSLRAGFL